MLVLCSACRRRHKEEISHIPNESSYLSKLNKRSLGDHGGPHGYDEARSNPAVKGTTLHVLMSNLTVSYEELL